MGSKSDLAVVLSCPPCPHPCHDSEKAPDLGLILEEGAHTVIRSRATFQSLKVTLWLNAQSSAHLPHEALLESYPLPKLVMHLVPWCFRYTLCP